VLRDYLLSMPEIREISADENKKASIPKGTKAESIRGTTQFADQKFPERPRAPVTWVDGSGYIIHRNGSKASSSSVLTGSHHPPALWKARNDYYSSSQPLQIVRSV